ncbi:hypothetical protein HDV00_006673 [Rhizophlyctis rosea]|nr:hypothetical protein HDV00_006673 [Rhizophlyctis rosea]
MIEAASRNCLGVVEFLLEKGVDVNAVGTDWFGDTALATACDYGHAEVVKVLLEAGADATAHGSIALKLAAEGGYNIIVSTLLDAKAEISTSFINPDGWYFYPPLVAAARSGNVRMAEILLAAGADLEVEGGRAMRDAVKSGHVNMVRLFWRWGAYMDTAELTTMFATAMSHGHMHMMSVLAGAGADLHAIHENDDEVLFRSSPDMVHLLVALEAPHYRVHDSAITRAVRSDNAMVLGELVEIGANVNVQGLLSFAARNGYSECVRILLAGGANIDFRTRASLISFAQSDLPACVNAIAKTGLDIQILAPSYSWRDVQVNYYGTARLLLGAGFKGPGQGASGLLFTLLENAKKAGRADGRFWASEGRIDDYQRRKLVKTVRRENGGRLRLKEGGDGGGSLL